MAGVQHAHKFLQARLMPLSASGVTALPPITAGKGSQSKNHSQLGNTRRQKCRAPVNAFSRRKRHLANPPSFEIAVPEESGANLCFAILVLRCSVRKKTF